MVKVKILSKIYMSLIFLFLYLPIFILVIFSFNDSKSRVVWSGFTFKWYVKLFSNGEILRSLANTVIIAAVSAVLATIIGTIAGVSLNNLKKVPKKTLMVLTNFPMINPEIVTGVSLMLLFISAFKFLGIMNLGMVTLILSHTTFCVPYVILSILPKLNQLNPNMYEAALDLGCTPVKAFFKVILPEILPGIITGMVMAFTLSLDDFVISYFTSGTTMTLPIVIYSMTRKIVSPEINALSSILFVVVFLLLILINIRQKQEDKSFKIKVEEGKFS